MCYIHDILALSETPKEVMKYLGSKYTLKEGSVKEPDQYLGAEINCVLKVPMTQGKVFGNLF
jgi:hypothetical protein